MRRQSFIDHWGKLFYGPSGKIQPHATLAMVSACLQADRGLPTDRAADDSSTGAHAGAIGWAQAAESGLATRRYGVVQPREPGEPSQGTGMTVSAVVPRPSVGV